MKLHKHRQKKKKQKFIWTSIVCFSFFLFVIAILITPHSSNNENRINFVVASTSPAMSCAPDFQDGQPQMDEEHYLCSQLKPDCVKCQYNASCVYGQPNSVRCHVTEDIQCKGDRSFDVTFNCFYCWQLPESSYSCLPNTTCRVNTRYPTMCSVNSSTYCLGSRVFSRYKRCNFVTNYKWTTAILFSILGGGFGLDRFYLGHWQEGIGKLFSFGGFGLWTLIDSVLVWTQYLKPADTSHYIND